MAKNIIKHELVEILIPRGTTQTKFNFPDLPNLRNVKLLGVQAYYNRIIPFSPITQNNLIAKEDFLNCYTTFVNYAGREFLKQSPNVIFQTVVNNFFDTDKNATPYEQDFKTFVGQRVNYPKSYVEFSQNIADFGKDQSVMYSIYYLDPLEDKESTTTFKHKR